MTEKIDEISYLMQLNKRHGQTMTITKKLPSTYIVKYIFIFQSK